MEVKNTQLFIDRMPTRHREKNEQMLDIELSELYSPPPNTHTPTPKQNKHPKMPGKGGKNRLTTWQGGGGKMAMAFVSGKKNNQKFHASVQENIRWETW